mgnify:CR=1 FL=1
MNNTICKTSALTLLMLCLSQTSSVLALDIQTADRVFINAKVYTANLNQPFAEAVAIEGKTIQFVGSNNGAKALVGGDTEIIDLNGKPLLPGFIDNHNHIFEAASEAGGNCELSPEATPSEQLPYLRYCLESSKVGEWVIGWGHTIDLTMSDEEEFTPLEIIDTVFNDRPVIIMEQTSHSMWVNSVALTRAGITVNTPDPQGGKIMKDPESGELMGILVDNAGDIVMAQAWNSLDNKFSQSYDGLLNGLHEAAQNGITTVGDGRLYWKRGWYDVWKAVQADGELTARISLRPWIYPHLKQREQLTFLKEIQSSDKSQLLIVDQVKMYSDGIIVNGTAKTLAPYTFTYFPESPYGINYIPSSQMKDWLKSLDKIGYGAHIHAIGDGGVRDSLDSIEAARKAGSKQHYNMTHVEMVNTADISRFKSLDVDADFQVGSDYLGNAEHDWAIPLIGKQRAHDLIPLREIYNTGANVTLSSDWNVNPISPMAGIANAVKLKEKGLPDVAAAIDAYTINAAKALGLESVTGSIEVGKSADLVILDRNIIGQKPGTIKSAKVIQTVLQGEIVYAQ